LPEAERGWYEFTAILPYDNIVAFDEDGDDWYSTGPHVYTSEWINVGHFSSTAEVSFIQSAGSQRRGIVG
jgi:hypothetical protein